MQFLLPNYSCLQNPWLGGYRPQIPVLSVLCPQLNLLKPSPNKIPGYATGLDNGSAGQNNINTWFFLFFFVWINDNNRESDSRRSRQLPAKKISDSESWQPLPTGHWNLSTLRRSSVVEGKIKGGCLYWRLYLLFACCAGKWDFFIMQVQWISSFRSCEPLLPLSGVGR